MPIIKSKKDWWDTIHAYWDEIVFLFHHYVGLDKPISENGDTIESELKSLKGTQNTFMAELIEILNTQLLDTNVATEPELEDAVGIIYDLHDSIHIVYSHNRVYKDKGRGNQNEGLGKNEGLEAKRARFKEIMVSSWAGRL